MPSPAPDPIDSILTSDAPLDAHRRLELLSLILSRAAGGIIELDQRAGAEHANGSPGELELSEDDRSDGSRRRVAQPGTDAARSKRS